jgi:diguanylate cyclase (GGDEF)-like protein/PAS domain S-box-containing protein
MKIIDKSDHRIFAEQLSLLFRQYPVSALSGVLVSIVVLATMWSEVPRAHLLGWMFVQNASLFSGMLVILGYRSLPPEKRDTRQWFQRYMLLITVIGLCWGSVASFLSYDLSPVTHTFLVIFVAGLAATALVVAVPVFSAFVLYLSLILLPMVAWMFLHDSSRFSVIGSLGMVFYALLVFAGRSLNLHLANTIRVRFENVDLANEVRRLNENLEHRVIEKTRALIQKTQALSESEERFQLAIQGANDGLWDWDLDKNDIFFSPRWKSMLGYEDQDLGSSPNEWHTRIHPQDRAQVLATIQEHLEGRAKSYESMHRMQHKEGHWLWVLDRGRAVRDVDGHPHRLVGTQADITDQKHLEEQLKSTNIQLKHEIKERRIAQNELAHLAKHDPLTELPNRILFFEQLQESIRHAEVEKETVAVLLVDLDDFKIVNDTLGHPIGDKLLVEVAQRLNGISNKSCFLSRFGGDEFLVIHDGASLLSVVEEFAQEIIDRIAQPFYIETNEIHIGCSIGITVYPEHGTVPNQLIRNADIAMYHAKKEGRNTYRYYSQQMDREVTEKASIRNLLHGAMERKEFVLSYQPQVDIETGKVVAMEALLRWKRKDLGTIAPERFIPLLEESGLIANVGEWALREACVTTLALQQRGYSDLRVAVNMSPRQFLQPDLAETVQSVLRDTGLDAPSLKLEITENIFMEHIDLIQQTLLKLQALGIEVILDDFGTGYSSLQYLKRLPINGVKIDKEFVADMLKNNGSRELVQAIIAMAKGLNMTTLVAEGVESDIQLELLRRAGCPTFQGFLHSKPLEKDPLFQLLLGDGNRERSS